MSAALYLAENGIQTVVLEAKPYVGGRARSFVDEYTGETIDNGQHVMMGCYHAFRSLLRRLRTEHLLQAQTSLRVVFRDADGRVDVFESRLFRGKLGAVEALWRLYHISRASKLRALLMMTKVQLGASAKANETCADFFQRHRQGDECIRRFWEPLVLATLNAEPRQVAASLLIEVLRRSILAGGSNSSLLIPQVGLSDVFAPFEQTLREHGGTVHLRTRVANILCSDPTLVAVSTEDDRELRADAVILAVPPKALEKLMALDKVFPGHQSPIVSVYLWFDREVVPEDFAAVLGTTIQWVFNRRRLAVTESGQSQRYPGHLALTVSAAGGLSERNADEIVSLCLQELQTVYPDIAQATLVHSKVIKERLATVLCTPETEAERPTVHSSYPRVFIAGDWTATGLPATLEGAAQSGIEAAKAVLMSCK